MKHFLTVGLALTLAVAACGDDDAVGPTGTQPAITAVSPAEGTVGTEVRIDGTGFVDGATVTFGSIESDSVDLEAGALFAFAPAGLTAGTTYDIGVVNPGGKSDQLAAAFTAVAPSAQRVNGVSKPTGLREMTIIIEGSSFGDALALGGGKVWFTNTDGTDVEAVIADSANDWTDGFIVTSVPMGVTDTSYIWVETATGVSDSIQFRIIQSGTFSPSTINWTRTTALPQALQGLGAVFVPVEEGSTPANYVFVVAGADTLTEPTNVVYRATILESGALGGAWAVMAALPAARAYHATAAATGYTAALDTTTTAAYVYVIGGQDTAGAAVADVFVAHVDLAGQVTAWTATTALPEALHSARAVLFRGFVYLTGGARADGSPSAKVYRAAVNADGTLGDWVDLATDMPVPAAYHSLLNFGPFLYVVGGDSTTALPPVQATLSNGELPDVYMARVSLRTGELAAPWNSTTFMGKGRSKHSTVFGGGDLFVTSGMYAGVGTTGSSENIYGSVASDGTVSAWNGATGSNTINAVLGINLYNQAAITFIDAAGEGHVLVLGGADRANEGVPSAAVVYY
ncbi:MAG TPA: IPT/TIG domain-containing protein [Longimicrobiales bacterium]|nr:IPT/TIG domain-containing protein [Longimicrobiales bacterium]